MKYSKKQLKLLSTPAGLELLLSDSSPDFGQTLRTLAYKAELRKLQIQLIKMQNWVVENEERVLILFEGGEFAGKGSAIRAFMEHLNPRSQRLVALPKPTPEEQGQWYFQRYIVQLPKPGEIVFFDRSWYNRAVVEPVNGFCTKAEYEHFMRVVIPFERMLREDNIHLIKLFFSISKEEQASRIEEVRANPLRRWELTHVDENAQGLWNTYKKYEKALFSLTYVKDVPWTVIDGNDRYAARLSAIREVLSLLPYRGPDSARQ